MRALVVSLVLAGCGSPDGHSGASEPPRAERTSSALVSVMPLGKLGCASALGTASGWSFAGTSCYDPSTLTFQQWGVLSQPSSGATRELEMSGRVVPGISKDPSETLPWTLQDIAMSVAIGGQVHPLDFKQSGGAITAPSLEVALSDALTFGAGEAARFRPRASNAAFPTVSNLTPGTPVSLVYESPLGTVTGTLTLGAATAPVPGLSVWSDATGHLDAKGTFRLTLRVGSKRVGAAGTLIGFGDKYIVARLGYTDDECMDSYTDDECMDSYTDDSCMFHFLPSAMHLTGVGASTGALTDDAANKFLRFTLTRLNVITGIELPE